jgi:hypothetical protein
MKLTINIEVDELWQLDDAIGNVITGLCNGSNVGNFPHYQWQLTLDTPATHPSLREGDESPLHSS